MTTPVDFDDITASLPGLRLPGAVAPTARPRRTRTAAQRAAYEKWAPELRQDGVGERWADPALERAELYHPGLRVRLAYRRSYRSRIDGEVYVLGTVVGQGAGTALAVGGVLSAPAKRLRRIVAQGTGQDETREGEA